MPSEAPAVNFALSLLEILSASGEPLSIAEISRKMDLNKTMVSRILSSLVENGWVSRSEDTYAKYQLTLKPFRLFSTVLHRLSVYDVAFPVLKSLCEQTNETTQLCVLRAEKSSLIQNFTSKREVRVASELGVEYPLHCTAPGKILLAYNEDTFFEHYLSSNVEDTEAADALRREREDIRIRGYALDDEEYARGIVCCAVPVFDYTDQLQAAIGVASSSVYGDAWALCSRVLSPLQAASNEISSTMGKID